MKRAAHYYGKNEAATMRDLGLSPVPRSGAGWVHKEDGENEVILCQLKSTDAAEARVKRIDLDRLAYHAAISHKVPLFAVQFLSDGKIYFVIEKDKFADTAKALEGKSEAVPPPLSCAGATQEGEPRRDLPEACQGRKAFEQERNLILERRAQERRARCRGLAAALRAQRREEAKEWKKSRQL